MAKIALSLTHAIILLGNWTSHPLSWVRLMAEYFHGGYTTINPASTRCIEESGDFRKQVVEQ